MGAELLAKGVVGEAAKDAYKVAKDFVVTKFRGTAPLVEKIDQSPDQSSDAQKALIGIIASSADDETKRIASDLLLKIEQASAKPEVAAVIDVRKLRALKNFEISDATFTATLIRADEATFEGDFKLTGLRQGDAPKK